MYLVFEKIFIFLDNISFKLLQNNIMYKLHKINHFQKHNNS